MEVDDDCCKGSTFGNLLAKLHIWKIGKSIIQQSFSGIAKGSHLPPSLRILQKGRIWINGLLVRYHLQLLAAAAAAADGEKLINRFAIATE